MNKSTPQQYSYLLELGAERLGIIFKPEIGFGLLGEFAHCLNCELTKQDTNSVFTVLEKLGETNRFKLTVDFLSNKETEDLKSLFEKLRNFLKEAADDCKKEQNISLFENLEKVYGIKK